MDLEKLLSSFEKLFYNIIVLIVLGPITIYQIFRHYKFGADFVKTEYDKKPEDRHKQYVSPVLLLLLVYVYPFILFMQLLQEQFEQAEPWNLSFLGLALFYTISVTIFPLLSALYLLVYQKKRITSDNLIKPYYAFTYNLSTVPIAIGLFLWVILGLHYMGVEDMEPETLQYIVLGRFIFLILAGIQGLFSTCYTFRTIGEMSMGQAILATAVMNVLSLGYVALVSNW